MAAIAISFLVGYLLPNNSHVLLWNLVQRFLKKDELD